MLRTYGLMLIKESINNFNLQVLDIEEGFNDFIKFTL